MGTAIAERHEIPSGSLGRLAEPAGYEAEYSDDLPNRRLFTCAEFERAGELGLFKPGERLELIEGEIISKAAPMKTPHASAIRFAYRILHGVFAHEYVVDMQLPLVLGERSEPEPDIAVLYGLDRDYLKNHPSTAVLVVEISDTTLRLDRTVKAGLYARAEIPEYWIVNVKGRLLEVHREPAAMADRPIGHGYRSVVHLTAGDTVSPLAAPATVIAVADLLP